MTCLLMSVFLKNSITRSYKKISILLVYLAAILVEDLFYCKAASWAMQERWFNLAVTWGTDICITKVSRFSTKVALANSFLLISCT